jgi:hypothetical protein
MLIICLKHRKYGFECETFDSIGCDTGVDVAG